ncbi:class II glutamine amidotransferase [Streptomyces sp. NPDC093223]|uniref:class II glutamine amidotransferase n=1 Tax=Streptomyces sp. NPDC093223 TaxID=3366033 RepID=UPI0038269F2D
MCRLLGVVANRRRPISDLLARDLDPFLALAAEHRDGWGVGLRGDDGTITSVKSTDRADTSFPLRSLLNLTSTDAALLHLRMASPGFGVTVANTHPFGDDTVAFAHNGDFTPSTAIDEILGAQTLALAAGETDSERFHLAVWRRLTEGSDPADAILRTASDIRARADHFASLNCMLMTRDALYTYVESDPDSDVISRRGDGYFGIHYRQDQDAVVVASVGWPRPESEWTALPERHVLKVSPSTLEVSVIGA